MVEKAEIKEKVSAKGNKYYVLVITFNNGYAMETFLTNEQKFIIEKM